MAIIAQTITNLNFRDSRPNNSGNLGNKLGTWRTGTQVQVIEFFDDLWVSVYQDESIVFAHSDYLKVIQADIDCHALSIFLGSIIEDMTVFLDNHCKTAVTPDLENRVLSIDGGWLTPIFSNVLSSNETDHENRNSVDAWDISRHVGSDIYPVADGIVVYNEDERHKSHGYGIWTVIQHGEYYVYYCHQQFLSNLTSGDSVYQGVPFSKIGMTGLTSWPHIHMEVHNAGYNGRLKPSSFWDVDNFYYSLYWEET